MVVKRTLERMLQDGDDRQTMRSWFLESDGGHITVRRMEGGEFLMIIRPEDVPLFVADLAEIASVKQ